MITNVAAGTIQAGNGGSYASGMVAQSGAKANGNGYVGKGGTATATTSITNAASVSSFQANGIIGGSYASAVGFSPTFLTTALNGAGTGAARHEGGDDIDQQQRFDLLAHAVPRWHRRLLVRQWQRRRLLWQGWDGNRDDEHQQFRLC